MTGERRHAPGALGVALAARHLWDRHLVRRGLGVGVQAV